MAYEMQMNSHTAELLKDYLKSFAVYRTHEMQSFFAGLKEMQVKKGWELTWAGISLYTGKPYINSSRQKWRMHYCDSEQEWVPISFVQLSDIMKETITEDNWLQFVEKEDIERFIKMCFPQPLLVNKSECEPHYEFEIEHCFIRAKRYSEKFSEKYGGQILYFRKCEDGYRALFTGSVGPPINKWVKNTTAIPFGKTVEEEFEQLFRTTGYDIFDRYLTDDEVTYFMNTYESALHRSRIKSKNSNSIEMTTRIENTDFYDEDIVACDEIAECIRLLATRGIKITD